MPASQSQVKYAAMIKAGKVKASQSKRAWAEEVLDRMRGHSMSELPVRASSETKYPKFGKRK